VRFDTRISETNGRTRLPLGLLLSECGGYKHCVMVGQANCGDNLACTLAAAFKLPFEIGITRQSEIVNQS
jgi:hypothetical protein